MTHILRNAGSYWSNNGELPIVKKCKSHFYLLSGFQRFDKNNDIGH